MGFIEVAVPSVGLDSLSLLDLHYHSVQWTVTVLECRYSPFFFKPRIPFPPNSLCISAEGTWDYFNWTPVPSVSLGSHPLLLDLRFHRGYKGLLMCLLNAGTIPYVNLGSYSHLSPFA